MKELMQKHSDVAKQPLGISRRKFMAYAGGLAGATLLLDACSKDKTSDTTPVSSIDLGSGDIGLLNYAYALEQLEAAFYIQVLNTPYKEMSNDQKLLFQDIRDHEIAHREFLKNLLAGKAIQTLEFNFSSIDFTSKTAVLNAAATFEQIGVSAYNGASALIVSSDTVLTALKIASVEARHAAWIKDLISWGSFSDNTDANGIEASRPPAEVLPLVQPYIKMTLSGNNLPTIK